MGAKTERTISTRIVLDGEKEYTQSMKSINSETKLQTAELNLLKEQYSNNQNSLEYLQQRVDALSKAYEAAKEKVTTTKDAIEAASKIQNEYGQKVDESKAAIARIEAEMSKLDTTTEEGTASQKQLQRQLDELNRELRQNEAVYDAAGDSIKGWETKQKNAYVETRRLGQQLDAAKGYMKEAEEATDHCATSIDSYGKKVAATTKQTTAELKKGGQAWIDFGTDAETAGKTLSKIGKSATKYITTPLLAAGVAAGKVTADFDVSMSKVQALSGATGQEFDALRAKARALGADTKFSASESADAMGNMALAGWTTNQMLTGIDGVLDLAASSGMDLAMSADVVAGNLAAFNMEASESTRLADLIATAQSKSKTTADQLAEAYSTSATNMTQAGQAAETTTALLEGLASVNDTGSAAGTKLSAVMAQITKKMTDGKIAIGNTNVTVQDANGNFRDMIDIVEDIEKATYGMGDAERAAALQTTFNRQSMNGLNELLAVGSTQLRQYRTELENSSGSAAKMADTMQDNLAGQLTILKSQLQELAIGFGDIMMPTTRGFVGTLQSGVDTLNSMDDGTREMIIKAGLVAAAMGPATNAVGKLTTGIGSAVDKIGVFSTKLSGGGGVASALASTLGMGGTAGLAVAGGVALIGTVIGVSSAVAKATDPVNRLKKHLTELADAQEDLSSAEDIVSLCSRYDELRAKTTDTSLSADELSAVQAELAEVRAALSEATNGAITAEGEYNAELDKTVANQKILADAEKERADQDMYISLVDGAKDYQKNLEKQVEMRDQLEMAEGHMTDAMQRLSAATANAGDEFERTGKTSFRTSIELDDASTCAAGATKSYYNLKDELAELDEITAEYESNVISLVRNGYLPASTACVLLGTDHGTLKQMIELADQQTRSAEGSAKALAEEELEVANAAAALEEEEENASESLGEIAAKAEEARTSGGNLREAYEELEQELKQLKEKGDEAAVSEAEQALAALNLAATNQELAGQYPSLVEAAKTYGYAISDVSQWLIDNEITADEWAENVRGAANDVMSGFQELDTSLDMSLSQMAEQLSTNITAYRDWNSNIQELMAAAVETGDQSAVDFVNYMQSMGIGAAAQVATMVENMGWTMETFPPLMAQATEQGMLSVYNEITGSSTLLPDAMSEAMNGAVQQVSATDFQGATAIAAQGIPAGIMAQSGSVAVAGKELAMAAHTEIAQIGWSELGEAIDQGVANGMEAGSESLAVSGKSAAMSAHGAIAAVGWVRLGRAVDTGVANGIRGNSGELSAAGRYAGNSAYTSFGGLGWSSLGYSVSSGIARGIRSGSYLITSAATAAATEAYDAARKKLEVNSPSKLFARGVGMPIPEGIALGITTGTREMTASMEASVSQLFQDTKGKMLQEQGSALNALSAQVRGVSLSAEVVGTAHMEYRGNLDSQMNDTLQRLSSQQRRYAEQAREAQALEASGMDHLAERYMDAYDRILAAQARFQRNMSQMERVSDVDIRYYTDSVRQETLAAIAKHQNASVLDTIPDLTAIQNAARGKTISASATKDDIYSAMVFAVDALGKKLSNGTGDVYTVNGVTYDDGSGVAQAVGELVRAVQLRRRM